MLSIIVVIFALAYAAIALEQPVGINKSASALLGAITIDPAKRHSSILNSGLIGEVCHITQREDKSC